MFTVLLLAAMIAVVVGYVVGFLCVLVSIIPVFVGTPLINSHLLSSRASGRAAEGLWEIPAICAVLLVAGGITCYGCHHAIVALWAML